MNEMQREVLIANKMDLRDIVVTESLLAAMQDKIFDQELIELIRVQRTSTEKISLLLDLLPKRGPNAFDNFVLILQESYSWLAIMLQTSLENRQRKAQLEREKMEQEAEKAQFDQLKAENSQMDVTPAASPRKSIELVIADEDIRTKVSSFVQRQFGQIRRIANTDKKMIERFMTEWLHQERKRLKLFYAKSESPGMDNVLHHPDCKEWLQALHRKLAPYISHSEVASSRASTSGHDEDDDVFMPDNISFEMISDEIEEVIGHLKLFENKVNQCKDYFGDRKTDLAVQVHNLMSGFREKESELVIERQKLEDVLVELYELSTKANKLQQACSNNETEILHLKQYTNKLRAENVTLINEITSLERANMAHLEKEKTLEDLRQTKQDMETLMKIITQENSDLKQQLSRGAGRYGNRSYPGRRPTPATGSSAAKKPAGILRKTAPQRKSINMSTNK